MKPTDNEPKVKVYNSTNNPELSNKLQNISLTILDEASKVLIDNKYIHSKSQVLTSLLSTFVTFSCEIYGPSTSLLMLNELSKYIRNSEAYKNEIKEGSKPSGNILNFPFNS